SRFVQTERARLDNVDTGFRGGVDDPGAEAEFTGVIIIIPSNHDSGSWSRKSEIRVQLTVRVQCNSQSLSGGEGYPVKIAVVAGGRPVIGTTERRKAVRALDGSGNTHP